MKAIAVIPARYSATRFPGKPLADLRGKPMVQWVYEGARRAKGIDQVIVATDDKRIFDAVKAFGGAALMTSDTLLSGTDRVAAVAEVTDADIYLNVQGDEPLIEAGAIEGALALVKDGRFTMSSAMTRLKSHGELENRTVVKALADRSGKAIYFSRYPIPYSRVAPPPVEQLACFRHLGLYVYRKDILKRLTTLPPSPLELGESLEQLRALDNGIAIGLAVVESVSIGVDTPEDLETVKAILAARA